VGTGGRRLRVDPRRSALPALKLILFVLPLGLDTFAVSTALGLRGLPRREQLKASVLMSVFEMAMPIVGLLVGSGVSSGIGGVADYVAAAALLALAIWMLFADDDATVEMLAGARGTALLALGLAISLDELAMGFTMGLLHLSIPLAVILIGAQAFAAAQLGLRLGARLGVAAREWAERLAAAALAAIAILIVVEKLA
jgi:putative Mn2+ efflux pump MntP